VEDTPMRKDLNEAKLEEVALALLALTKHAHNLGFAAWKGLDWDLTDRLHDRGWIGDPKGKSKSIVFTDEGARLADEFLLKHFAVEKST
jgi:hypothetical protein